MRRFGNQYASTLVLASVSILFLAISTVFSAEVFEPPVCPPPNCQPTASIGGLFAVLSTDAIASPFNGSVIIGGAEGANEAKVGIGTGGDPSSTLHVMKAGFSDTGSTHNLAQFGYEAGKLSGNRQVLIQQWGNKSTTKQFLLGNGYINDKAPSLVNGPYTRAIGLMWDDDSMDVVINSEKALGKAGVPVSAVTINSETGNVGIGTTNPPQAKLHLEQNVNGTLGAVIQNLRPGGKAALGLYSSADFQDAGGRLEYDSNNNVMSLLNDGDPGGSIAFSTRFRSSDGKIDETKERVRITDTGNVGIGTTSPSAVVDIETSNGGGPVSLLELANPRNSWSFRMDADHGLRLTPRLAPASENPDFHITKTDGTPFATFSPDSGNVGIGTTRPADALDVAGNITLSGGAKEIRFRNSSGAVEQYVWHTGTSLGLGRGSGNNSMFITSTGSIGIGTGDPSLGGKVRGRFTIDSADDSTQLALGVGGIPRFALNTNTDKSWTMYDYAADGWTPGITQNRGNVSVNGTVSAKSAQDAVLNLQTTDDKWLYTQWLTSNGTRRIWMGLDTDLSWFNIQPENGTQGIVLGGEVRIPGSLTVNGSINAANLPKTGYWSWAHTNGDSSGKWVKIGELTLGAWAWAPSGVVWSIYPTNSNHGDSHELISVQFRNHSSDIEGTYDIQHEIVGGGEYSIKDIKVVRRSGTGLGPNKLSIWAQANASWLGGVPWVAQTYGDVSLSTGNLTQYASIPDSGTTYSVTSTFANVGGNVGIGTTNLGDKLTVGGNISIDGAAMGYGGTGRSGYGIAFPSTSNDAQYIYGEHDGGDTSNLVFHQRDNANDGIIFRNTDWNSAVNPQTLDYMKISREGMYYIGGSVGIGTTSPQNKLHVGVAAKDNSGIDIGNINDSEGGTYNINFYGWRDTIATSRLVTGQISAVRQKNCCNGYNGVFGTDLVFSTNNGWSGGPGNNFDPIERMRISQSGTVTVPNNLNVGMINFRGTGGNSGQSYNHYGIYQEPGDWSHPYPDLMIEYHTGIKYVAYYNYGGHRFYAGYNSDASPATEVFSTGNGDYNTRVNYNLLVNGNVGIGTSSPAGKLDVAGDIRGVNEYSFSGYDDAINDWDYSGLQVNPSANSQSDDSWYIQSNATQWDRGIMSKRRFRRTPGLTLEYEAYMSQPISGPVHYMVGFVDGNSSSYSYGQNPSNLMYHDYDSLKVYENGSYRGTSYTFDTRNAWYKFKVVLKGTGADYFVYRNGQWNGVNSTDWNGNKYVRVLVSAYHNRMYFRNMRVYQENQQHSFDSIVASQLDVRGKTSVGTTAADYLPGSYNWNYTLLLNAQDTSSIGFHDSGSNVGSIRFKNNLFTIGENDGWGVANTSFAGNVGIGGNPGGYPLLVNKNGEAYTSFSKTKYIQLMANGNNQTGGGIAVSDDGGFFDWNDGYITYEPLCCGQGLRVNSNFIVNKNVGIGTASPSTVLTVKKLHQASQGSGTRMIDLKAAYPGYDEEAVKASIYAGTSDKHTWNTNGGYLAFLVNQSGYGGSAGPENLLEAMRIEKNGNVGIGIADPDSKLHVRADSATMLKLDRSSNAAEGGLTFADNKQIKWYMYQNNGGNDLNIQQTGVSGEGDDTPRLRLPGSSKDVLLALSGGNVGIGTTDPGAYKLAVNGDARIYGTLYDKDGKPIQSGGGSNLWYAKGGSAVLSLLPFMKRGAFSTAAANGEPKCECDKDDTNDCGAQFESTNTNACYDRRYGPYRGSTITGYYHFYVSYRERKIGIGTDTAEAKLQIMDPDNVYSNANNGSLILGPTNASNLRFGYNVSYSWIQSHGSKPLAINPVGNYVGIGTDTPQQLLHLAGSGGIGFGSATSDKKLYSPADGVLEWMTHALAAEHAFAVSNQGTKQVYLNTFGDSYLNGGNVGIGIIRPQSKLHVVGGDIRVSSISENKKLALRDKSDGFDIAELFESDEIVEVGDVMVVSETDKKLRKSKLPYERKIVGVVSTAPAILFEGDSLRVGAAEKKFEKGTKPPIALAGRVPVKVSLENGPINVGDYLTSSSQPGVAMKATDTGMTIGIALESYDSLAVGSILVFLNIGTQNIVDKLVKQEATIDELEKRIEKMEDSLR